MRPASIALLILAGCTQPEDSGTGGADAAVAPASSSSVMAAQSSSTAPVTSSSAALDAGTSSSNASSNAPVTSSSAASSDGGWWQPAVNVTWQWQLTGTINEAYMVDVYDIDLFDTPQAVIDRLHGRGIKVMCYFSAGSSEDFRDDFSAFQEADQGNDLDGWPGERWLDIRSANVLAIMQARLDVAVSKRCDGVEPDNVDGFTNDTGFPLTAADQLAYNGALARQAHARGLAVALKNDGDQADALAALFDLSVNEQCHQYTECDALAAFTTAGKPILNAEYAARYRSDPDRAALCALAAQEQIQTLVLDLDLDDSFRFACNL